MTGDNRRDFIKKLAAGAVYTAPVVLSMSAPRDLAGQGKSSQHKHGGGMGMGMGMGGGMGMAAPIGPSSPGAPPPGTPGG